jgi:hypothetical protein
MALSGHSGELALVDLIQANAMGRNTCRIAVYTPTHNGVIFMLNGAVVHASLGDLTGPDAFYATATSEDLYFHVDSGVTCATASITAGWQSLLLEAMKRKDEGLLRQPSATSAREGDSVPRAAPGARQEQESARRPSAPGVVQRTGRLVALGLMAAVAVAVVAWFLIGVPQAPVSATTTPIAGAPADTEVVEATALTGPKDVLPRLVSGAAPRSPDPTLAMAPSVVCRLLVVETGRVAEAKIYRSRLDLARFEEAALDAAASYRFTPAIHDGKPVRVWLNWPVSFQ